MHLLLLSRTRTPWALMVMSLATTVRRSCHRGLGESAGGTQGISPVMVKAQRKLSEQLSETETMFNSLDAE